MFLVGLIPVSYTHLDVYKRQVEGWLSALAQSRRVIPVRVAGIDQWAAIEDAGRLRDALGASIPVGVPQAFLE